MGQLRRVLLSILPQRLLSFTTGVLVGIPLPGPLRAPVYRWFARRYCADLTEVGGELSRFRSLAEFFARPLRPGARPVAAGDLVWPCDGRVISSGAVIQDQLEQIKGSTYPLAELLGDPDLARALIGGTFATIYLAPGDYHRVHAPFAGAVLRIDKIRGRLFPVNPAAVASVPGLFTRNARVVFVMRLTGGRPAAVVMVGALNVGHVHMSTAAGATVTAGAEIGRFGFGSTVIALAGPGTPVFAVRAPGQTVRTGERAT